MATSIKKEKYLTELLTETGLTKLEAELWEIGGALFGIGLEKVKSSWDDCAADVTGVDVILEALRCEWALGTGVVSEDFVVAALKENLGISLTGNINLVSSWTGGS